MRSNNVEECLILLTLECSPKDYEVSLATFAHKRCIIRVFLKGLCLN